MPHICTLKLPHLQLLILLVLFAVSPTLAQNPPAGPSQVTASLHLVWPAQQGVLRYRLQLARDEGFQDIVFDRAVFGTEYLVTDLTMGRYFWRVAPAVRETGTFSSPRLVEVTGDTRTTSAEPNRTLLSLPEGSIGWRTTTGAIAQPLVARLRSSSTFDVVGVNAEGMAYGLEGGSGVAIWAARFRPDAKRGEPTGNGGAIPFRPVLIQGREGLTNVVVAYDGGVRALEGATGKELWRAPLAGPAFSGAIAVPEGGGAARLLVTVEKSGTLSVLNPMDGKLVTESKFDAVPLAAASEFPLPNGKAAIFALEGGMLDVRNSNGERIRALRMDTSITTPPLVVSGPRGTLVWVGTANGLISLNAEDLKPISRIATEGDVPTGMLAATDLEGDGAPEVILITRQGQLAAIGTSDGKIKWHNTGAADAASAAFADLNADGVLDVLIAAGEDFAHGYSGRDGALIWRAQDMKGGPPAPAAAPARSVVAVPSGEGANALLVGTDTARSGLRAISLPKDSVRAANE